ncbi:MAG: disulfide bond formation protein DsbA [Deltaproteobacteria bacterium]|nr:disulfide bond formation protein DsbA [Deltaproteobacteria bacterium]
MTIKRITHYFDYKSPYAYLAQADTFQLQDDYDVEVDWVPYTLDIPSYLGSAKVDATGKVLEEARNAHQWRRVKYSYMDCRREANRRGLVIRGTQKIFDSSIAHIGLLYAKRHGNFRPYHNTVYGRFWRRELDIENPAVIQAVLQEGGIDSAGFLDYLKGEGRHEHDRLRNAAEEIGIFGVPSYLVNGELFWGNERLVRVQEKLEQAGVRRK